MCVTHDQQQGSRIKCVGGGSLSRFITVEPIVLGSVLCQSSAVAVITDLITRQACRSYGTSSLSKCLSNQTLENEAQKLTANIQAINTALSGILPVIFCILIGPWSDTNGRKPFLNLAVYGQIAYWLLYVILASIEDLNPTFLVIPSIAYILTGGPSVVFLLTFAYATDVSSVEKKTIRMGLTVTSSTIASCTGPLLGGWLFGDGTFYSYITVFGANVILAAATCLYTVFCLPESITSENKKRLFTCENFLQIFKFLNIKRPKFHTPIILLILLLSVLYSIFAAGETEVQYLSLQKQFRFGVRQYSYFTAFYQAIACVYNTFGIWLFCSILKIPESLTLCSALALYSVSMLFFANAQTPTWVYAAYTFAAGAKMSWALYRSIITNNVTPEEIGITMTILQICETFFGDASSAVYASIYGMIISDSPLKIYYLSACVSFLAALSLMGVHYFEIKKNTT